MRLVSHSLPGRLPTWGAFLVTATLLFTAQALPARELPDFTGLVDQYGPAVVNISTTSSSKAKGSFRLPPGAIPGIPEDSPFNDFFRRFFDEEGNPEEGGDEGEEGDLPGLSPRATSLGSGFILSADGYIVTNHHVIDGAEEIIVRLNDRRELQAKLVGSDERSDVALLKVEAKDLPVVRIGSSQHLKVGEWVLAIGSPFGFDHSATAGIVSAKGRSLPEGNNNYVPFIQTDVAINPGNSGGPLFNLEGEVVGVNAQIFSRTGGFMGLSFTIPIDMAMNVIAQLKDKGKVSRGWLGVLIQDVTGDLAESFGMSKPQGALIAKIFDGPAKTAGFKIGDVVVQFNGQDIVYSSELPPIVGSTPVGNTVDVKLIRDGKETVLKLTVGELPADEELATTTRTGTGKSVEQSKRLGLAVTELTSDERKMLDVAEGGVLVKKVSPGAADTAGIRNGDVLLMVNGQRVNDVPHFTSLVDALKPGQSVPVLISRRGAPTFLVVKVPQS